MAKTSVRGYSYPEALRSFPHFQDTSWGNDVTDSVSFWVGDTPVTVWIEPEDPKLRSTEFGWEPELPISDSNRPPPRFMVCLLQYETSREETIGSHQSADASPLLESDDPAELGEFLGSLSSPAVEAPTLQWDTAQSEASRIVQICQDIPYIAPEDTGTLQGKLREVSECMNRIAEALQLQRGVN